MNVNVGLEAFCCFRSTALKRQIAAAPVHRTTPQLESIPMYGENPITSAGSFASFQIGLWVRVATSTVKPAPPNEINMLTPIVIQILGSDS